MCVSRGIECRLEDKVIKFEIWDTAGQERFHSLAPMYYRNAAAAVVVYDVTKASSLEKAKSWVNELQRQANPNIVIALVGNKVRGAEQETIQGGKKIRIADIRSRGCLYVYAARSRRRRSSRSVGKRGHTYRDCR